MKRVRFANNPTTAVFEVPAHPSKLAQRFGYQDISRHKSKSLGPVSEERLARIRNRVNNELMRRGYPVKIEQRGRFTVYHH